MLMAIRTDMSKYRDQRGLTLIEVMVALLIIGISVLALYIMFINGKEMITEQYHRRVALEKARALMEDMEYSRGELGRVPDSFRGTEEVVLVDGDDREEITADQIVTVDYSPELDDEGNPFYNAVSVVYEWEELSGREYRVELRAWLAD
jgi:prepilin-type N-terminal cleavage/methylation domain-containing protein